MNVIKPLIRYASRSEQELFNKLTPFEQAQALLYQLIYAAYLEMMFGSDNCTPLVEEYIKSIENKIMNMVPTINVSGPEKDIYNVIYHITHNFDNKVLTWKMLDEVLSYPPSSAIVAMCPSRDFYLPVLDALGFGYPYDIYPDGRKPTVELYTPHICVADENHKEFDANNGDDPYLYISFGTVVLPDYDFGVVRKLKGYSKDVKLEPFEYLSGFNFSDCDMNNIIGILASFSLEKVGTIQKYGIRNTLIYQACYDVVSSENSLGVKKVTDPESFFNFIKLLRDYHRIGDLGDTQMFSQLLSKFKINSDLSSYFAKPITQISATEAMSFRSSILKDIFPDRTLKLKEYLVGTESETVDPMTPPDDTTEDSALTDTQDLPGDTSMSDDTTTPPPRDPEKLLLELVTTKETYPDVIFKQLLRRRIRDVLSNPPKSIIPKELLLLKKWLTHYIGLYTVNSAKDFLSRLSFRLNDLKLTKTTM